MNNIVSSSKQAEAGKRKGLREKIIPLLTLLLVIAIMVALFFYRDRVAHLGQYGYLGVFLVCLASNASVILPVPGILLFFPLVTTFNPVLLGLAGATGGAIGEITGYMAGYSGRLMIQDSRIYHRMEGWMKRWGIWAIFVFAVTPFLLVDIAGMVAGVLRFPMWKFLLVVWVGKTIKYIGLLLAAAWGWEIALRYFS